MKVIDNIYTISAMAWKPDGSRLTIVSIVKFNVNKKIVNTLIIIIIKQ